MKKSLMIFGMCFLLLMFNFVSAISYAPGELDSEFDSIREKYSLNLEGENGKLFTFSFLEFSWIEGEEKKIEIFSYLTDNGADGILGGMPALVKDITYKQHFWGCLDGASFTQKFGAIFELLIGKNPIYVSVEEEQEFEAEARTITATPGTGAYNTNKCLELCYERYPLEERWRNKDIQFGEQVRDCENNCTLKFNCGIEEKLNSLAPDGAVGIKRVYLFFNSRNKQEMFGLEIGLIPETGDLTDITLVSLGPEAGGGIDGFRGVEKELNMGINKETGNFLDYVRWLIGPDDPERIEKFDSLYESEEQEASQKWF